MLQLKKLRKLVKDGDNEKLEKILKAFPFLAKSKTDDGITLLQYAAYCGNPIAMAILRRYKRVLNFFEAISMGDIDLVTKALDKNPERLAEFSPDGFTPLGLAAYFGHYDIVTLLLQRGANPNVPAKNSFLVTPLHSACAINHYEIAALLLKRGANPNARQMQGVTALHSAAHNGNSPIVELLLKNGANINAKMDTGQTPLMLAQEKGAKKVVALLKGAGGV
jgi:uncharacterized protein